MVAATRPGIVRTIRVLIAVCFVSIPVHAQYGGGSGEPNDPYRITSADDLLEMSAEPNDWDKHFVLTGDIDMAGHAFTDAVIGRGAVLDQAPPESALFRGTFDGNDFVIRNLVIDAGARKGEHIGLFGGIGTDGVVRNLGLEDVYVVANDSVGGLAGLNRGRVDNCRSDGSISGDTTVGGLVGDNKGRILDSSTTGKVSVSSNDTDSVNVGGLVGSNDDKATISNCYSTGEVRGLDRKSENFGGLAGSNQGRILSCYSTGSVSGSDNNNKNFGGLVGNNGGSVIGCYSAGSVVDSENVGGIAGYNDGRVSNCYSIGSVSGIQRVGGLLGDNEGDVINCYSIGTIIGTSRFGGLVGDNSSDASGSVHNCFWDVNSSGLNTSDGGVGLATSEMMSKSHYQAAGWDFVGQKEDGLHELWQMPASGGYPVLGIFNGYEPAQLAGNGTAQDPYLIGDANELAAVLYGDPRANYHLLCNLDLSDIRWSTAVIPEFGGVLDGNGFVISNLTISGANGLGLFGAIDGGAEVRNLGVEDVNVAGSDYVGGLAGKNGGKVRACYATGAVAGGDSVGGLAGYNSGSILISYSTSSVKADSLVGGLVGDNNGGEVIGCYSTGSVGGRSEVGGLVGTTVEGNISTCYSTGQVTASSDVEVGGLVGSRKSSTILASVWDMETSGWVTSDGGIGKTTEQMQAAETFLELGWDIMGERENGLHEIWQMPIADGYPVLSIFNGYEPPELAGKGTAEEPHLISDANELGALLYYDSGASYRLVEDVNLAGIAWSVNVVVRELSGVFDGNDHTIANLYIDIPDSNYVGLFGRLEPGSQVRDLGVVDAYVVGTSSLVGVLAGSNQGSVIDCYTTGVVAGRDFVGGLVGLNRASVSDSNSTSEVSGDDCIGGLVGQNREGTITTSHATGAVTGIDRAGGLVGGNTGDIVQCFSAGEVTGADSVGGLVGDNNDGSIVYCYSRGAVRGNSKVGGLAGNNYSRGIIMKCYSTGEVTGSEDVGGIVGNNRECHWCGGFYIKWRCCSSGTVNNCFWDVHTSGLNKSDGGAGKTTAAMKSVSTYVKAGWNFGDVWEMPKNSYPKLLWHKYKRPAPEIIQIRDANGLVRLASNSEEWNKYWILSADIDLSGVSLEPIGDGSTLFTGVFDGNDHTISNVYIDRPDSDSAGLFGRLSSGGLVKNLGLEGIHIQGTGYVGGIVGFSNGKIDNCHVGGIVSGVSDIGGIVGYNNGSVNACSSTTSVGGDIRVGGLVGMNSGNVSDANSAGQVSGNDIEVGGLVGLNNGTLNRSKSSSDVTGDAYVGGLVGRNTSRIENCYSMGTVSGDSNVGGLVGYNEYVVKYCYATGDVAGNSQVGGLIGSSEGTVSASFWDIETSGRSESSGGNGKETSQMMDITTFLDKGWDCVDETENGTEDIWWILDGEDYPRLWWEWIDEESP